MHRLMIRLIRAGTAHRKVRKLLPSPPTSPMAARRRGVDLSSFRVCRHQFAAPYGRASGFNHGRLAVRPQPHSIATRLCATKPDLSSSEGRLGFHQAFLEDRLKAVKAENPKLVAFYKSLDAGQKSKFDKFRERMARKEGR